MKKKRLIVALLASVMCMAVTHAAEPWKVATANVGTNSVYRYVDKGGLSSVKDYRTMAPLNASSDDAVDCQVIHTSAYGQLGELLGEHIYTVDSLVVYGPVDSSDIEVMWRASFEGKLKVIDLENATVKDGRISDDAFWHVEVQLEPSGEYIDCIYLRKIILPENVVEIGNRAFAYAINLEYINFPTSLRRIGESAFAECIRFKVDPVVFPEGMEKISTFLFLDCEELTGEIVLPSTIKTIGTGAFFQSKITSINLPEGLTTIGDAAFYACRLKEVCIPESCQNIEGSSTFQLNLTLEKLHLPEGLEYIPSSFCNNCRELRDIKIPSTVKVIRNYAFWQCVSLKSIELPECLESIDFYSLYYLAALEQIRFPSTLRFIGRDSCKYWQTIKEIYCEAIEPPVCEENGQTPFGAYGTGGWSTPQDTPVYVPIGSAELYRNAWGWDYFTNFIETDFSGIEDCVISKDDARNAIYDLQGRKVSQPLPGRVYIQNGKKMVLSE